MTQDNWRNNASRVRMKGDASPPPEEKRKVAASGGITRAEIVILALVASTAIGMFSYKAGEWKGAASVASVTPTMTLEELGDKYGNQEWAVQFDDERVVAMWDRSRKVMTYLHLTYDDYAALYGERSNWTREDRFGDMVSAAIRRRETHQLSISNPLKK